MPLMLLNQVDVRRLLDPATMLDVLGQGFVDLTAGKVAAPGRDGVQTTAGALLAMPGWLPGSPIGVKLVAAFHGNPARGLPGHQALICLFDEETGTPLAVMDGAYITALRTAGGAVLSAKLLARPDACRLAIIGGGVQGVAHAELMPLVRDIREVRVWSRNPASAARVAAASDIARVFATPQEAVLDADIICLCTTAQEPPVRAAWVAPGAHVTSVGYNPPGGELDRDLLMPGALFVETRAAFAPPPVGCDELQGLDPQSGVELGEVLSGTRPGRTSAQQITVYKSMGHAMEDVVTAALVYQAALAEGVGTWFDLTPRD
ncbi:MAG: ornithine cyclodeaminase family protein [Thermomicrobiales bacterium]|nr:ornithine cyclodeaminase family protein [Thermomicrobiales bacterium]